ncbi:MAG: EVE domain-containing protein [Acidimicrobiia bacterium]|nr:EVE domain-containing protein [Acidimicrobiia bacterium]
MTTEPSHWVNTISLDHVQKGVDGGFTQADHGRNTRLSRLRPGDWLVFYSPRTHFRAGDAVQAFTALGRIDDGEPYQVKMTPDFHPWRRPVAFISCETAPIRPLIDHLEFITDKKSWGYPFRRGLFEIDASDFAVIAEAMGCSARFGEG